MVDFIGKVSDEITNVMGDTLEYIGKFAPVNELTERSYKSIMSGKSSEAEFMRLRDKYGDQKVYEWITTNQLRGA